MAGVTVRMELEPIGAWWQPLVRWFVCLPHLLWAQVLQVVSVVISLVIGANVLLSGRVPARLVDWQVMSLRERVRAYGYFFVLRQSRPPLATERRPDDPGDDPFTHVSAKAPTTATRGSVLQRPLTLLLHLLPLLPMGVFLDLLYPVWMVMVSAKRSWSPWFVRLLLRTERWVAAVVAYVTYVTNEPPAFGLSAYARPEDPA